MTGWGSPDAQVLVHLLARFTSRSKTQQDQAGAPVRAKLASTNVHDPYSSDHGLRAGRWSAVKPADRGLRG
jgi:hypothetical protein